MDDDLDQNWRDRLVAASKGAAGMIPYIGGPLGEIISSVIPQQRLDRIVSYLEELESRLNTLEDNRIREALVDPVNIDLIETGGYQAARAITEKRIEQISEAVFSGIQADDAAKLRKNRLLSLFGELDDDEISLLNAYGQSLADDHSAFDDIHLPDAPGGLTNFDQSLADQNELYKLGNDHLLRLGLLRQNFISPTQGKLPDFELPDFDMSTGRFKGDLVISSLGRMLLREIGMPSPIDL